MAHFLTVSKQKLKLFSIRIPQGGLSVGADHHCDLCFSEWDNGKIIFRSNSKGLFAFFQERAHEKKEPAPNALITSSEPLVVGDFVFSVFNDHKNVEPFLESTRGTIFFNEDTGSVELSKISLLTIEGPDQGNIHPICESKTTIGTDQSCDIVLSDRYVSRWHATLLQTAKGIRLVDNDSTNGTKVNDLKITDALLTPDSIIQMGTTALQFQFESNELKMKDEGPSDFCGMIGNSKPMRRLFALLDRVAPTNATVLLCGPSGSGKELAARGIHAKSNRKHGPFIPINCSAIPAELVESELFGHVKGAFTGAFEQRKGMFELANGGTLFLDEVSEMPMSLQPKLLRALEYLQIRKVGSEDEVPVDIRIIAATNKDLKALALDGHFRDDLYYRLAQIPVDLPPLSERVDDILLLLEHFIALESEKLGLAGVPKLSEKAEKILKQYPWPGNVRELRNTIQRALILLNGQMHLEDKDFDFLESAHSMEQPCTLEKMELHAIKKALKDSPSRKEAAKRLGIAVSTLYDKIKKHGL